MSGVAAARGLAIAGAAIVIALAVASARFVPPAARGLEAPAGEFSAARARLVLERLVGDGVPHPAGSDASARVRSAIVGELERLGYAPEVRDDFVCGAYGSCAFVHNVVVRLEGREPGKAVLLVAHYDSVAAGPGAADDGAGIAAMIEIARAIKAGAPLRRPTLLLFDEAEEPGLLGALSFVEHDRYASEVGAVINFEARGTSGLSTMFETSGDSSWLVDVLAGAPRPAASSLYAAIYEALPNDTDLTIFKSRGVPGFNFGFIGEPSRYHTPLDDLAHLDPASLQHHGDNGLAALRGLAESPLDAPPPRGRAVFFDVLGVGLARWPEAWAVPLAALAAMLIAAAVALAMRREGLRAKEVAWGVAAWAAGVVGVALAAGALFYAMTASGATPRAWIAHPGPALTAFAILGAAGACASARLFKRAGLVGIWSGAAIGWCALALAVALALPGASYLFLIPAAAAGAVGLALRGAVARRALLAVLAPMLAASLVWLPVLLLLYDAVGVRAAGVIALGAALLAAPAAAYATELSARATRAFFSAAFGATAIVAAAAPLVPRETAATPEQMEVALHADGDTGRARWVVSPESDALGPALRTAAPFAIASERAYPWSYLRAFIADAGEPRVAPPDASVVLRSVDPRGRHVALRVASQRGATEIDLYARPSTSLAINGRAVPEADSRARRPDGWLAVTIHGVPREGLAVDADVLGDAPTELIVGDRTSGPPDFPTPAAMRPPTQVTTDDGDFTLVTRRVAL